MVVISHLHADTKLKHTYTNIFFEQEHPWHAAVVRGKGAGVDVWAGAGQGEGWDEGKWGSQVSVLMGDGFYHR